MEMCPYCGEDLPADSKSCWKCGTELAPGGGGEIKQRGAGQQQRGVVECPYCQAEISVKALRCNECGRQVAKGNAARNWVPAVYASFGLVLLGLLVGLVYSFFAGRSDAEDPARRDPIAVQYSELYRIYVSASGQQARKERIWKDNHQGKFVRWEMVILKVHDDQTLELAGSSKAKHAEVLLALDDPSVIETERLREDKTILYTARLERFEDKTLHCSGGRLADEDSLDGD